MTTSRIEEVAQKAQDLYFELGAVIDVNSWNRIKDIITEAHQAGIDDGRGEVLLLVLEKLGNYGIPAPSMESLVIDRNLFIQILEEALQDNK